MDNKQTYIEKLWRDLDSKDQAIADLRDTLIRHLRSEFEMWSPDVEVMLIGEVK